MAMKHLAPVILFPRRLSLFPSSFYKVRSQHRFLPPLPESSPSLLVISLSLAELPSAPVFARAAPRRPRPRRRSAHAHPLSSQCLRTVRRSPSVECLAGVHAHYPRSPAGASPSAQHPVTVTMPFVIARLSPFAVHPRLETTQNNLSLFLSCLKL